MSDEINIDFTDEDKAIFQPVKTGALVHAQQRLIEQLQNSVTTLQCMVAELRRELDELHARHRPKEDQ